MDDTTFFNSPEWDELRRLVIARDGYRCSVAFLLGGMCSGQLHVHHIEKRTDAPERALDPDNLGTCCSTHHPQWEAIRQYLVRCRRPLPPCRHKHRYRVGQEACDRERARKLGIVLEPERRAA